MNYSELFVPLSIFGASDDADFDFKNMVPFVPENFGPIAGMESLKIIAKALLNHEPGDDVQRKEWGFLKQRIQLQLIKDTKEYGTTSVSMGFVQRDIDESGADETEHLVYVIGNCGINGMSVRFYKKVDGVLRAITDDIKRNEKPSPNPNILALGEFYRPLGSDKETNKLEFAKQREYLEGYCKDIRQKLQELQASNAFGCGQAKPSYYLTFITGPARAAWEKANPREQVCMEESMNLFFEGSPFADESWCFMKQKEEGYLELLAAQTMHFNLAQKGLLGDGSGSSIGKRGRILACGGVGMESLQFGSFLIPFGMSNAIKDGEYFEGLTDAVQSAIQVEISSLVAFLLQAWRQVAKEEKVDKKEDKEEYTQMDLIPIIALKSGMLLLLNSNKDYLAKVQRKAFAIGITPIFPPEIEVSMSTETSNCNNILAQTLVPEEGDVVVSKNNSLTQENETETIVEKIYGKMIEEHMQDLQEQLQELQELMGQQPMQDLKVSANESASKVLDSASVSQELTILPKDLKDLTTQERKNEDPNSNILLQVSCELILEKKEGEIPVDEEKEKENDQSQKTHTEHFQELMQSKKHFEESTGLLLEVLGGDNTPNPENDCVDFKSFYVNDNSDTPNSNQKLKTKRNRKKSNDAAIPPRRSKRNCVKN